MEVRKSVLTQLQSVSEGALEKIAQNETARSAITGAVQLKGRGERMLHGLETMEDRLAAIEARLAALEVALNLDEPAAPSSSDASPEEPTAA